MRPRAERTTRSLGAGVTLLLIALLAMASVTGLLAWRAHHVMATVERQGRVSEQLRSLNQLMMALLSAETGQRVFLPTHRSEDEVEDATAVAEKILQTMEAPMGLEGLQLQVATSIGIALHDGRSRLDAAQLLASADAALYEAKRAGRQRYVLRPAGANEVGAYSTLKSK